MRCFTAGNLEVKRPDGKIGGLKILMLAAL
jgi:hypothetical protein